MSPLLLAAAALAFDRTEWWAKEAVGAGGWPSGLISNTRAQLRTPLWRTDGIPFRDTYAGIGGRFAVTPAFVDVGPRLSLAPIAVFDVDVQASWHGYFGTSSSVMPFEAPAHKLESERNARGEDGFAGTALSVNVQPTLKAELGPFVGFDAWMVEWWHVRRPDGEDAPYVYEPLRDVVLAWDDTLVQQQAAVMWEIRDEPDGPLLWVGPTVRDTYTLVSRDRSTSVGGVVQWRAGAPPRWPVLLVQVLPYVTDADRVGGVPNIQGQLEWTFEHPVRPMEDP